MSEKDKATDDSQVDLTDTQLDDVSGGPAYLKLGDIRGESQAGGNDDRVTESISLNFAKVEYQYGKAKPKTLATKTIKW